VQSNHRGDGDGRTKGLSSSDQAHFEALRTRTSTVCNEFVRDHYALVYGWLVRLTGHSNDAADLTQDAFAAFWESLLRETPAVSPRTWLFAIARNRWRKHCRARSTLGKQTEELDDVPAPPSGEWPPLWVSDFEQAVHAALAELPADFREVFTLRTWDEFDYAQIGTIQGISAELARWRYFRARKHLQARLQSWAKVEEQGR
jgi:RNA polymerase sigma-70 factor (ECF subfamily)